MKKDDRPQSALRGQVQPQRDLPCAVAFLLDGVGQLAFRDHALRAVGVIIRRKKGNTCSLRTILSDIIAQCSNLE